MDYQEATRRLWNHANLPQNGLQPEASFLWTAWQAEQAKSPQNFQPLYEDVLACLAAINFAINGPVPSETNAPGDRPIDRSLCYCVSGILAGGWSQHFRWSQMRLFPEEYLREFASLMVRIGTAWDLVLAGDIDDLQADTEIDFIARQA